MNAEVLQLFAGPIGYLILFIGTLLEGELIVIIAGYMAEQGLLNIWLVILVSFLGSFIIDQSLFYVGYYKGDGLLKKFPQGYVNGLKKVVKKFETPSILLFRFVYGTRTISPLILGSSKVNPLKFTILNFISGVIWAIVFSFGGYFIGTALSKIVKTIEIRLAIIIAIALIITLIVKFFFHKKASKVL